MNKVETKIAIAIAMGAALLTLSACEQAQTPTEISGEIPTEASGETLTALPTEASREPGTNAAGGSAEINDGAQEQDAEELLDLFIDGSINAIASTDLASEFSMADLNRDAEEWSTYFIGEKVDLDNDGDNELVLGGPYGGKFLDARDGKVYEFASGGGTALDLSYVYYHEAVWVLYSNSMNVGYKAYHMEQYEGADNLVAEMNFGEELVDPNNAESGMKYTVNGTEVSYDEYTGLCSKIFATEVYANQ